MKKKSLTPEEFIALWQKSWSAAEVAKSAGCKPETCRVRASNYRKRGIHLKYMPGGPGLKIKNVPELAALAKKLAPKE